MWLHWKYISVLCSEECPPVSSVVHLTLKIFSLYFVFGTSVFVYKTLSVIIRNLSNFWLSLGQPLPTHVTIETAQELCYFIHNTCIQMGIQAVPVALPRSLWTPEVCGMRWCQAAVTSAPTSCYFTTQAPQLWASAPSTCSYSWENALGQPWSFFIFYKWLFRWFV